jgi:NADH:ubiquinone oxidoreductase subunit 5 (subunit L)/multisubunit Na+/H+ antiporter MnhA subunit
MVMGIGTLNPIGIAGGLFHMLNNAIYKSCLFLSGGAVEHRTKTSQLDKLGGLAKFMPLTFISSLIASLSISGVPPFNGFFSKWMVYQGVISLFTNSSVHPFKNFIYILALTSAIFGSALTLASFLKLLHATFLGQSEVTVGAKIKEVSSFMWIPQIILAGLCILFGIFAYALPIKKFIAPAVGTKINLIGIWSPALATILIVVGLIIGIIIYKITGAKTTRKDTSFVGGEILSPEVRPTGIKFYNTVKDISILNKIYKWQDKKFFDIYEIKSKCVIFFAKILSKFQSGLLPTYIVWIFLGFIILALILLLGG